MLTRICIGLVLLFAAVSASGNDPIPPTLAPQPRPSADNVTTTTSTTTTTQKPTTPTPKTTTTTEKPSTTTKTTTIITTTKIKKKKITILLFLCFSVLVDLCTAKQLRWDKKTREIHKSTRKIFFLYYLNLKTEL
uniref:Integumentary mucin C.1-like n=1 Tax=Cacopsylla melanoneura TaxID=428564 RepID=A0A8D8TU12_9HEMI